MASDPILEGFWRQVVEDWANVERHQHFLDYCQQSDQLVEAATRYRQISSNVDREPVARQRLAAISILALAKLEASRTPAPQAKRHATAILAFALLLATLVAVLIRLGSGLE